MTEIDPLTYTPSSEYMEGKKPLVPEGIYPDMTITSIEPYAFDPEDDKYGNYAKGYTHKMNTKFVSADGEKEFTLSLKWGPEKSGSRIASWRLQKAVFGDDKSKWGGFQALMGQRVGVVIAHGEFNGNPFVEPTFTPVG